MRERVIVASILLCASALGVCAVWIGYLAFTAMREFAR